MKKLLCIPVLFVSMLFMLGGLAFGQAANVPVCNSFSGGVPAFVSGATTTTNCTDYFAVGNYANSPLPAGTITGYTLISGGSGYSNPWVVVTDPTGLSFNFSTTATLGVVDPITVGTGGTGYTMPQVTIVDVGPGGALGTPTCGGPAPQPACGTGAMATAVLGGTFTGGIQKFLDPLVDLKTLIAIPDTTTFPGDDYYEIALVQYKQQMHSNLAPTTLRGYVQVPSGSVGCPAAPAPSYLGPVIVATKNKAVRVKFTNCLTAGSGGNLFIPVDTTYMGAGMGPDNVNSYTQNRATLHLHGGATPWISDGTPHQWTVPVGDTAAFQTGVSVAYVPDMFFDSTGKVTPVPQCGGTISTNCYPNAVPAGLSNNPGQGSLTFFWTNQQGGRLLFYHDHAYGITRLNVYAGEAAGYLLVDPTEENMLAAGSAPGTLGTAADLPHLIPLVIQDKTFVPSATQIALQDPTWAANYGTTPGTANPGDLWYPHVYTPNQDPNDPTGANGFGRWDYGAWFFPPQTSLTAAASAGSTNGITLTCTSAAFPGQTLGPTPACPSCGCPITPNPSGTPEGFMDTPVVNGVAYPVLHVSPTAYRFKILSVGNDRSLNLSWFVADPLGYVNTSTGFATEVKMLPSVAPVTGALPPALPLCPAINPVTNPGLDMGLATALLDPSGNPLNGTGLPLGCWPNYGRSPGIPVQQTMWAADGRAGGVPDPTTAGPPWIQIGTEGGLLPAPVVIPATPIGYEANTRSITITNVSVHGLWLGPAERADVIVDFSQFAGKTLIMYNDAPTPAPAIDSRLDYFTGDGDQSPIGGAPNTQPGYGPNTRTIMQVVVDGPAATSTFSLPALKAAFAGTAGAFATTQPTPVVPEAAYNSAYNQTFTNTYASIQANTLTFTPITPLTFDQACTTLPLPTPPAQCGVLDQKAIQELFTLDYGRMNATLGTELPLTNFLTQTTIPLAYIDPATEIIKQGDTQLWKITHNGVDTHFIHFHLFNVQVVNRMGWDGTIRPPDANEVGWKDTVRMNPLEDILVALQPITPILPWPIPNSVRNEDVTAAVGTSAQFTNVDPFTNVAAPTTNGPTNFGWEYVWHCHILGHEENDMMRPIIFQVPPPAPSSLAATNGAPGQVLLGWTDNSANETGFTLQRDVDCRFLNPVNIAVGPSSQLNAVGEGTDWGGTILATDTPGIGTFCYQVQAVDNGFVVPFAQPYNATPALVSAWSTPVSISTAANASVSPPSLTFAGQPVNTTSAGQVVTLSNAAGAATLAITGISFSGANPGDFAQTSTCGATLAGGAKCTITVTFTPLAAGARAATLTIGSTNNPTPLTVSLTGTGIVLINPSVAPTSLTFSSPLNVTSAAQTVTVTNVGAAALRINSIGLGGTNPGQFGQTNTCGPFPANLGIGASCTISVTFRPTAASPLTKSALLNVNVAAPGTSQSVTLTGTIIVPTYTTLPASLSFGNQTRGTTSAPQTVTVTNTGTAPLTINNVVLGGANPGQFTQTNNCAGRTLANGGTCTINVSFSPTAFTARGAKTATLTVRVAAPATNQSVTLSGTAQ